jgi:hypothetical protein
MLHDTSRTVFHTAIIGGLLTALTIAHWHGKLCNPVCSAGFAQLLRSKKRRECAAIVLIHWHPKHAQTQNLAARVK